MESLVEKRIKEVLKESFKGEQYAIDGNILISMSIAHIYNCEVWLWGSIKQIDAIIAVLKDNGLKVKGIIDSNSSLIGRKVCDIDVVDPLEFASQNHDNSFVFILTYSCRKNTSGIEENSFVRILNKANVKRYYIISELDKKVLTTSEHIMIDSKRTEYYKDHEEELVEFGKKLSDEESVDTLIYYLKSYVTNDVYRGEQIPTKYKYFYGNEYENLYKHLPDENWLNCGASIGDTILSFFSLGLSAKNIWAFEADKSTYERLTDVIEMLPEDKKKVVNCINEFLDEKTQYNYINEKVTLLNADIEGNELSLLHSLKDIIKKDKPVIAICVYHLKEDLIEIPKCITELLGDCKFYLRKHTPYIYNYNRNHELVLYAIPPERAL